MPKWEAVSLLVSATALPDFAETRQPLHASTKTMLARPKWRARSCETNLVLVKI